MDGYRRTGGRTRCSIPPVVSNLRRGTYATQRVNIVPEGGTFGVSMYRPLSRLVEHSASPATRRSKRRLSHDKFGRSRKANEHSVVYFDHRPSVFLFSRPRRRRSRLNTTMRFQSSILLLLYAATLASEVQRAEECRQGAGDELIWEYDVRRPYRNGGYQVRVDYIVCRSRFIAAFYNIRNFEISIRLSCIIITFILTILPWTFST